jgi:hypothetical protein
MVPYPLAFTPPAYGPEPAGTEMTQLPLDDVPPRYTMPVSVLFASIDALGTTAPAGSDRVPVIVP